MVNGPRERACTADTHDLEALRQHAPALRLYATVARLCDDIVQDAFVALARQSRRRSRSAAWLYRVVRNGPSAGPGRRSPPAAGDGCQCPGAWFSAATIA